MMRAERRGRARFATGRRWAGPARGTPARSGGTAVSALDAGLVVVRSQPALRGLEADLRSGDRAQPVVGLACLEEINEPVLAAQRVREIVGAGPRIYYVPGAYLLRRLQGRLGHRLALPAGGARVWWPGLCKGSDPAAHPLVLALDSESEADMLAEFARQFDLSRPFVRGEIQVIEDARRLAEDELAQAREQNRAITIERDLALSRARQAERDLQAATQRVRCAIREQRP
jgi:hypothetical protein